MTEPTPRERDLIGVLRQMNRRMDRLARRAVPNIQPPTESLAVVSSADELPDDAEVGAAFHVLADDSVQVMGAGGFDPLDPDGVPWTLLSYLTRTV